MRDEATVETALAELRNLYEPFVNALAMFFQFALPPFQPEKPGVDNWHTSPWMPRSTQPRRPAGGRSRGRTLRLISMQACEAVPLSPAAETSPAIDMQDVISGEDLTALAGWPTILVALRQSGPGRTLGRRRRQKGADSCRRLQVAETRAAAAMPEKAGFLESRRLTRLGYGDLTATTSPFRR